MECMIHRRLRPVVGLAVTLGLLSIAEEAHALERGFTWERATLNGGPRLATDDLNFGLGINGGYTLNQGVYLGGLFNYFLGEKDESNFGPTRVEYDFDAWFLMFEGGFDFSLAPKLVVRPTFAMGIAGAHGEVCVITPAGEACDSDSDSDFQAAVSGQLLYDLGGLTIGGETRLFFADFEGIWFGFNIGAAF
jgi:hypothetical protein